MFFVLNLYGSCSGLLVISMVARRDAVMSSPWLAFWNFTGHINFGFSTVIVRLPLDKEVIAHVWFQNVRYNCTYVLGCGETKTHTFWE